MQLVEPQKDVTSSGLVSVVVLCGNSASSAAKTIGSVRRQSHGSIEIIAVQVGQACAAIGDAAKQAGQYIECIGSSRAESLNTGLSTSKGRYVVAVNAGDTLASSYVSECLKALRVNTGSAFAYTNYQIGSGLRKHTRKLEEYNLYELLQRNYIPLTALVVKEVCQQTGGYASWMEPGYEPWEFWIRLGARGCFGCHVDQVLLTSEAKTPGQSPQHVAQAIKTHHAALYEHDVLSRIKARWSPAASVVGADISNQTISDLEQVASSDPDQLRESSRAPALLLARSERVDPHSAELAALAVWGGSEFLHLHDGSLAVSRRSLSGPNDLLGRKRTRVRKAAEVVDAPLPLRTLHKHLINADLLSAEAWLKHPLRSLARLIPLRLKEGVNRLTRKPIFDLRFYLQFQPNVLVTNHGSIDRLDYMPKLGPRRRVAFITPHLGSGGAETVLLEIANSLDRDRYEIFVIATHSHDDRWLDRWHHRADHVYNLLSLVAPERVPLAILTLLQNWKHEFALIQNSLPAYSILPELKRIRPGLTIMDLVHSVDDRWDMVARTLDVSSFIDKRIVISELAQKSLCKLGVDQRHIRLIRNGIDLQRFHSDNDSTNPGHRILYAARLDPVKRPLLVVKIAQELRKKRGKDDFRFMIAGDGAERKIFEQRVERAGVRSLFEFLGEVPDLAPVLADSSLLIVTSENEGLPLVVLEALASGKPVVASNVGAIHEVLTHGSTGYLIEKDYNEIQSFAAQVSSLLDNDQLRRQMGSAGREKIKADYDRVKSSEAYASLFN